MTRTLAVVCLLATTACVSENELRYTSTLQAETNGVRLSEDGYDGVAAMAGTTCTIDANWGCPVADEDLPTEEEKVVDHYAGTTLGASEAGLHTIDHGQWMQSLDVEVRSLRTAALLDRGTLAIAGDVRACTLSDLGLGIDAGIPGELCEDGVEFTTDRHDGVMYAATALGEVFRLDDAGATKLGRGDLVSWDAGLGVLYTAWEGDTKVSALRPNGTQVWQVEAGAPVSDLEARGNLGEVLVLIQRDDGLGAVERRDGESGQLKGRSLLPDDGGDMVVSENGRTVGFVRPTEVHFFSLVPDGEADQEVIDPTPADCLVDVRNRTFLD